MAQALEIPRGFEDTGLGRLLLREEHVRSNLLDVVVDARLERGIEEAARFTVDLLDTKRKLIRSRLLNESSTVNVDGLLFEYIGYSKNDNRLQMTFRDAAVADLRRQKGPQGTKPKASTRTKYAERLVNEVRYLNFRGDPGERAMTSLVRGKHENSWKALTRLAGERQWRCFVDENTVFFGSDEWLLNLRRPWVISEDDEGIDFINPSYDGGKRATTCDVTCWARRWASRPGHPVKVVGLGDLAGKGLWLTQTLSRSMFSQRMSVSLIRKTPELAEPLPQSENYEVSGTGIIGVGQAIEALGKGFKCSQGPGPFGPITDVHTEDSWHYENLALDINWYGGGGFSTETQALIWLANWIEDHVAGIVELYHPGNNIDGKHGTHLHIAISKDGGLLVKVPSTDGGNVDEPIDAGAQNAKIREVFGKDGNDAIKVKDCESSGRPKVDNSYRDADGDLHIVRGLFMISDVHAGTHYPKSEEHRLYEVDYNIRVAYSLYRAEGWEPWRSTLGCHGVS
jgi:hypothetical protein